MGSATSKPCCRVELIAGLLGEQAVATGKARRWPALLPPRRSILIHPPDTFSAPEWARDRSPCLEPEMPSPTRIDGHAAAEQEELFPREKL
jgi:hypothetical protein